MKAIQVITAASIAVTIAVASPSAQAGAIFSNISADDTFTAIDGTDHFYYGWNFTTGPYVNATKFTATGSGQLSDIVVPLYQYYGAGAPAAYYMGLYADSGGQPGALLETWHQGLLTWSYPSFPVDTLVSVRQPTLAAGSQYWFCINVVADFNGQNNQLMWLINDQATALAGSFWDGNSLSTLSTSNTVFAPALELDALASVPAPGALWGSLVLLGAVGLLAMMRRDGIGPAIE